MILDYPGEPSVITRSLIKGRQGVGKKSDTAGFGDGGRESGNADGV